MRAVLRVLDSPWLRAILGLALVIAGGLLSQVPGREVAGLLVALLGIWLAFSAWNG